MVPGQATGLAITFSTGDQQSRFDDGTQAIRDLIVATNRDITDATTPAAVAAKCTALLDLIVPFAATWGHATLNTDIRQTVRGCEHYLEHEQPTVFDDSFRGGVVSVERRTLADLVNNSDRSVIIMLWFLNLYMNLW